VAPGDLSCGLIALQLTRRHGDELA
jgi:hypothetical protein